jgi:hypothetical protein
VAYLSCDGTTTIAPNIPPPRTLASRSMACFFRPPCSSLCRPRSGSGSGRAGFPSRGFDGGGRGWAGLFPGGSQRDQKSWSPARVPSGASGREERARRFQGVEGTAAIVCVARALHRAGRRARLHPRFTGPARAQSLRPRLPPVASSASQVIRKPDDPARAGSRRRKKSTDVYSKKYHP